MRRDERLLCLRIAGFGKKSGADLDRRNDRQVVTGIWEEIWSQLVAAGLLAARGGASSCRPNIIHPSNRLHDFLRPRPSPCANQAFRSGDPIFFASYLRLAGPRQTSRPAPFSTLAPFGHARIPAHQDFTTTIIPLSHSLVAPRTAPSSGYFCDSGPAGRPAPANFLYTKRRLVAAGQAAGPALRTFKQHTGLHMDPMVCSHVRPHESLQNAYQNAHDVCIFSQYPLQDMSDARAGMLGRAKSPPHGL